MKISKLIITIPFLLYSLNAACQISSLFHVPPIIGQVSNYQRFISNRDKETLIKEAQYDNKNRMISKKEYSFDLGFLSSKQQIFKTIYKADSIYEFSCNCKNIEEFVKKFKVGRYKEETVEEGNLVENEPSQNAYATISKLNLKGLVISKVYYNENGYPTKTIFYQYNNLGKLTFETSKSSKDGTDATSETQLIYNNEGEYTGKTETSIREYKATGSRIEKNIITYDKNNVEVNLKKFINGQLYSETICSDSNSNTKKFLYINQESPQGYINKIITYNTKGSEITISSLNEKKNETRRIEKIYDSSNNLLSVNYFNQEKKLFLSYDFQYDNQNNWTSLTHKQLIINTTEGEEKETYETTIFKQKITYSPRK